MSSAGDANGGLPGRPTFSSTSGADGAARGPVPPPSIRPTTSRTSARPGASASGRPGAGGGAPSGATTGAAATGGRAAVKRGNPRTGWRRFFNYPRYHVKSFRRWLPSWRVVVGAFLGIFALGVGVVVAAYATTKVPTAGAAYTKLQTSTVYYADGKTVIGTLRSATSNSDTDNAYANQNRKIVQLDDLPDFVSQAVVASEDGSFYKNSGVDPKGIARSLVTNLKTGSRAGGSTITQQYVERYFQTGSTTDYVGKFKEALLAIKVSKETPKEQVLQDYLNTIYFGRGAYGIETAAESYFGTTAKKLTPSQSALLAGIIPAPSSWDPANGTSAKASATKRWTRCLNLMADAGYITTDQHDKALKAGLPKLKKVQKSQSLSGQRGYLIEMVRYELTASGMTDEQMDTKGMKIVTTIDKPMEDEAVAQVKATPKDASKYMGTGLATVDPSDGAIKAIYGGPDYLKSQYNASAAGFDGMNGAKAQGGSTFKAFALAAGLEAGYSLDQTFDGRGPQVIPGWSTTNKALTNFEGEGFDNETLRQGFYESVNTVFGNLNMDIGPDKTQEMAKRLGVEGVDDNPANVLGTDSVSALQMASAYAVFASGGLKTTPHVITKATDSEGDVVYQGPTKQKRVIPEEVANGVVSAMQDVPVKGTAKSLPDTYQNPVQYVGRPVAGKTGSSNDNKAAWFVGFTPQLVTAVSNWESSKDGKTELPIETFGYWKARGIGIGGGTWPSTLWSYYMKVVTDGMPVEQFPAYDPTLSTWTPTATSTPTETATETPTETPTEAQGTQVPGGLVGQNVAAARQLLLSAGLKATATKQYSDNVAPDVVISVTPGEGSTVNPGTTVMLVISQGPEPKQTTTVPGGLVGQPSGAAQASLRRAGLGAAVTEQASDTAAVGTVISVNPTEGAAVDQGSTVTIVVSTGPANTGGGGGGGGGSTPSPTETPDPGGFNLGGN